MSKHLLFLALLLAGLPGLLSAQTLFIQGGGSVHVDNQAGGIPTLFVSGGISNSGVLQTQNNGYVRVADFSVANRGSIGINPTGTINMPTGEIELAGHWTNNGVINAVAGSRVEFNGTSTQNYVSTVSAANRDFAILQINSPQVAYGSTADTINVFGQLDFTDPTGNIINAASGAGMVVLEAGATLANQNSTVTNLNDYNSTVWGWVRRRTTPATAYHFPVGSNASAQPFTLTFNGNPIAGAGIAYVDARFNTGASATVSNGAPWPTCGSPTITSYVPGVWQYHAYNSTGFIINDISSTALRYQVNALPHGHTNPGQVVLLVRHAWPDPMNFYNVWHPLSTNDAIPPTTPPYTIPCAPAGTAVNLVSTGGPGFRYFSEVTGGTPSLPLPVELLPLEAEGAGDHIKVSWMTLSEQNSSHFVLERSLNNAVFEVIANNIPAAGNSNQPIQYGFDDRAVAFNQPYFYRLRAVDLDNTERFSNIAEAMITNGSVNDVTVTLYPNPTSNTLNIQVSTTQDNPMTLRIYDAIGKLVYVLDRDLEAGIHNMDLSSAVQSFAVGSYNAVVSVGASVTTQKLIVVE